MKRLEDSLHRLLKCPITQDMISFVACKTRGVIECSAPPSFSIPSLETFIEQVLFRSNANTSTFLTTVALLDRFRHQLPADARGMACTRHRIFLAALIVAAKITNDISPRNRFWAKCSGIFSLSEVNLMERQLLWLLDFDLQISEKELYRHLTPLLTRVERAAAPSASPPPRVAKETEYVVLSDQNMLTTPTLYSQTPQFDLLEQEIELDAIEDADDEQLGEWELECFSSAASSDSEEITSPRSARLPALAPSMTKTIAPVPTIADWEFPSSF
ncbi:uncharacterized protein VTP21DRAFT_10786 [Calcarisporiella thermophila]|uniref:uncharacterized protein n=1 Tax=Calcarisporiella thermophila TaxID=911321 RepID=UPI0037420B44